MESVLDKLNELVEKELDKIVVKGNITPAELEIATKAVCLIEKIKMVAEIEADNSYSTYRGAYGRNRNYYDGHNNYSMSREYYRPMDNGYSSHSVRDRMISQLESTMMDNANSESERRVIETLIGQLSSEQR